MTSAAQLRDFNQDILKVGLETAGTRRAWSHDAEPNQLTTRMNPADKGLGLHGHFAFGWSAQDAASLAGRDADFENRRITRHERHATTPERQKRVRIDESNSSTLLYFEITTHACCEVYADTKYDDPDSMYRKCMPSKWKFNLKLSALPTWRLQAMRVDLYKPIKEADLPPEEVKVGIVRVTGAAVVALGLAILAGTIEAWAVQADLSGYQGAWVLEGRDCADVYASGGKATSFKKPIDIFAPASRRRSSFPAGV